jgi:hypothetical protein
MVVRMISFPLHTTGSAGKEARVDPLFSSTA